MLIIPDTNVCGLKIVNHWKIPENGAIGTEEMIRFRTNRSTLKRVRGSKTYMWAYFKKQN